MIFLVLIQNFVISRIKQENEAQELRIKQDVQLQEIVLEQENDLSEMKQVVS
jgi:hypothetical protein